jgi:hypothetical protein
MPQLVQPMIFSFATYFVASPRTSAFWRLHGVRGDVDRADEHVLAVEQLEQIHRHMGVDAFDRYLIDAAFCERGKNLLVLTPLGAE